MLSAKAKLWNNSLEEIPPKTIRILKKSSNKYERKCNCQDGFQDKLLPENASTLKIGSAQIGTSKICSKIMKFLVRLYVIKVREVLGEISVPHEYFLEQNSDQDS